MAVRGSWVERGALTSRQRSEMLMLMQSYFGGVTEDRFYADLSDKDGVVVLQDDEGRIRGFSTLLVYESRVAPLRVAYSGDTIVDTSVRNSPVLSRIWIATARQLGAEMWLLITSGFRTYRFLPVFWKTFWPRYDMERQPALLDLLARERFGDYYADGVVRFPEPQHLHPTVRQKPPGRQKDPHIAYFEKRNPGWTRGDELVCICGLGDDNLTGAGRRMVRA